MAATPEAKVKAYVDKVLKKYQLWFYSPQAGPFGRAGIPDRIAIVAGQFVGVEVKADRTKKPTALQIKCLKDIERAGGRSFVVCDRDSLDELEAYIKETLGV